LPDDEGLAIEADQERTKLGGMEQWLLNSFIDTRVARVLEATQLDTGKALDVGSGSCQFANALAAARYDVSALEWNQDNERFAADAVQFYQGLFTRESVVRHSLAVGAYDVITLWHVLEHIPNPSEALALAYDLLKPGGVLYICVPNIESMQARLGGNYWTYLDVPHHVNHFSVDGLEQLLRAQGFLNPQYHRWSAEYEIFGMFQTLLNVVSRSHNVFYNKKKKGRETTCRYPRWSAAVNAVAPVFLPVAGVMSVYAALRNSPSCVEVYCYKE
jgi:2-polyprenyl-3-methyl-5-hydroxy-6-metoxy-1,4-benzoquinol methylase